MRTEDGNPRWTGSQNIQTMDYAAYAEIFGFQGIKVTDPHEITAALDRAFAHQGVTLLDVHTDKNVPPLPAHITAEFVTNTAEALLKGDPNVVGVVTNRPRSLVAEGVQKVKNALNIGASDEQ